jgi:hypothetical protein
MDSATPVVWRLLTTIDISRERNFPLSDSFLNIPESEDSIPDLLNEADWEIRWIAKMEREDDGGVYNKRAPHESCLSVETMRGRETGERQGVRY